MISSSVGSSHPGKYSYEIPKEYFKGEGTSQGGFQIAISLLPYVATFYFTSTQQLIFRGSYFFITFAFFLLF